jgi:hypothetical protein
MTTIHHRPRRFSATLLILIFIFAMVSGAWAQEGGASSGAASSNLASPNSALVSAASSSDQQASPQQPATDVPPQTGPKQLTNFVEAGGDYLGLSNGYGYWAGGYARGVITQGNNIWNAEVNGQHEFGDAGVYFAAGDTYNFNPGLVRLTHAWFQRRWLFLASLPRRRVHQQEMDGSQATDHDFWFRLLRREGCPPRSQFFRRHDLLLHNALDSRRRNSFQRQQSRIGVLSGRLRRRNPWTKPATVPYVACRLRRRGISTRRANRDS